MMSMYVETYRMSNEQIDMHYKLVERTKERLEGWSTHLLDRFFDLNRLKYPANLGMFAWSSQPIRVRWLAKPHAKNFGGGFVTPGDIARDYLAIKYPDRRVRCTTSQYRACVQTRKIAPIYAAPGSFADAVYVDIRSAYWQIVRSVGWDVSYNPSRWLGAQSSMTDFPYVYEKMARNCLVSVGLSGRIRVWTGSETKMLIKKNRFINLVLWRLVADVLNGVAADMVKIGARYVNTDGYILPARNLDQALAVGAEWGLDLAVKHTGDAIIRGVGSYQIGDYQSLPFRHLGKRNIPSERINATDCEWLKPRFRNAAERARADWWFLEA